MTRIVLALGGAAIIGMVLFWHFAAQSQSSNVGMCRATNAAPTYTEGQITICSMDLTGHIRLE